MSAVIYYLFILPISLLPFPVLYALSDVVYLVLYQLIGYRKAVVRTNLKNSFPEKSAIELLEIEKRFYHHFCDIILESIKTFTISENELRNRMKIVNKDFVDTFYDRGISVILVSPHYNNWEWGGTSFKFHSKHYSWGIYQKLNNTFFNEKMLSSRQRFGVRLVEMKQVKAFFEETHMEPHRGGFLADQKPSNPEQCLWMRFLNQDTPVSYGVEKYSREYKCAVMFGHIEKVKRGHYQITYSLVAEEPWKLKEGELTLIHSKMTEKVIQQEPSFWLWTHKRWKHKKPDGVIVHE